MEDPAKRACRCQSRLAGPRSLSRAAASPSSGAEFASVRLLMDQRRPLTSPFFLVVALAALAALAGACGRGAPEPADGLDAPPNLNTSYVDENGVVRTPVEIAAVVEFGTSVSGPLPARGRLIGYEFEAFRGARPTVEVIAAEGDGGLRLSIYGPRNEAGLWGEALESARGRLPGSVLLEGRALPEVGMYLVLLQTDMDSPNLWMTLRLECTGNCSDQSRCPELVPCDLVCPLGFQVDANGCRECVCIEAPPCDGGVCEEPTPRDPDCLMEAPVCDDTGRTWPNACVARERGARVASMGPCLAPECDAELRCPEGLICSEGQCRPVECGCPDEDRPQCDLSTGAQYRNGCELDCRAGPGAVSVPLPCDAVRPCQGPQVCGPDAHCAVVMDPDNLLRCRLAGSRTAPECLRICVPGAVAEPEPPPGGATCGGDLAACPLDQVCYLELMPAPMERGTCLPRCLLDQEEGCAPGLGCMQVSAVGVGVGVGVCLPTCDPRLGQAACSAGRECRADDARGFACQACDCPRDPEPAEAVCTADQRTLPSACFAECFKQDSRPGACEGQRCACGLDYVPVCGPEQTIFLRCELRCEQPLAVFADVAGCYGQRLPDACVTDDDCLPTGCDGRVCAAARAPMLCPRYSDEAACFADLGSCGCVNQRCGFNVTPEAETCVRRVREAAMEGRSARGR